ncbi:hypothetical protein GALMADRAFT_1343166 [Galerina marginata CBS 339.88]|uniref:Protein kinase domain-containing protein n=1 Tax=Galerina marginata (strain CBS 339.88) TaxID=685588 RepID=A0A067SNV4_GALM3|nr:hypothetical protein GALMADRAFT_1343166 [Galerina marginata CBS 339.88]
MTPTYSGVFALINSTHKKASMRSSDELELEEVQDATTDKNKEERSGNHGSAEEKKMYDPLIRLFSFISTFGLAHSSRRFKRTNGMLKADEPHTFGFPSVSPDITLAVEGVDASNSRKWLDRDGFGEVKPTKKQGPKRSTAGTIPPIVTQCADYARLFMSARPFMLFCVGILIFGTEFCIGIFDRDGITFSPIYDMFERPDVLVRVVRSLACDLSIEELGSDPTVSVLTDDETQTLTGQKKYPSAIVTSVGNDPRKWFPGLAGFPITVQNLRSAVPQPIPGDDDDPTPVLHRLLLGTLGRPMWEYRSDRELLTGFHDALIAHRNLYDRGILHRDISAGNILLIEAQNAPIRGFLSDLEFARVKSPNMRTREVRVRSDISPQPKYNERGQIYAMTEPTTREYTKFESTVTLKRGAGMTGTAQFMAREILESDSTGKSVVHGVAHDVESYIWVLSYCVMRSLLLRAGRRSAPQDAQAQCKEFRKIFARAFGQTTPRFIAIERTALAFTLKFPSLSDIDRIIARFMSDALVALFIDFQILLQYAEAIVNPTPLTHDAVLGAVDKAIASL